MATSSAVPVEEYLRTTYHPDMEYLEGQLVERHVGEYFHSLLQSLIVGLLLSRRRERRFRVFTEQRVQVSERPRYRIPDICVKALPHQITPILLKPDLGDRELSRPTTRRRKCSRKSATIWLREFRTFGLSTRTSAL
jgi:Uma2 family endonuclease